MADISSKPNVLILVSIPSCVGMRANYGGARAADGAYDLLMIARHVAAAQPAFLLRCVGARTGQGKVVWRPDLRK
jgi:hypothetical protein